MDNLFTGNYAVDIVTESVKMKRDFIVESKMLLEKITMCLSCKTGYNQRTMIYVS